MSTKEIKILLIQKDLTMSEIARRERVSRNLVSCVIRGKAQSLRIQKAIATALDVTFESLWGRRAA
jgi:transcriptional regulator with XRE-family HTH domain